MNKKIYLSALVLPAVFAACTQDDLVDLNDNKQQKRVILENVTFVGDAESRLAFEGSSFNSIALKDGDGLGAYLIDSPDEILTDEKLATLRGTAETDYEVESGLLAGYEINGYINGSHKFVYNGEEGSWTTLDQMVEGNYLYVLPYQEKKTREAITTSLPRIQYLKYKKGTTELDENSLMNQLVESGKPLAVGYEFLSRYNSEVAGNLKQIYAYPRITFQNKFEESVTVQKVVINSDAGFALEGILDIEKAAEELYNLDSDPKAADLKNSTIAGDWAKAVSGNWYATDNYTADIVTPVAESTVGFIVVVAPENLTVEADASIAFQAVIPAAAYAANDITIDVYTDKGIFQGKMDAVNFNNGLRYSESNYEEGALKSNTAADKYGNGGFTQGSDMAVAKTTITAVTPVVVVDTKDLLAVINGEPAGTATTPRTIAVAPLSSVAINESVVSALGNTKGLKISEDVEIEGKENGLVIKNIDFADKEATVTKGKVSFQNVANVDLVIEEGATVTVDCNFPTNADVINKGTLNVSAYNPDNNNAVTMTLGEVVNLGAMGVSTPLTATKVWNGYEGDAAYDDVVATAGIYAAADINAEVNNGGTIEVMNSISINKLSNAKFTKAKSEDKVGKVTVNAGKMLKTQGENEGEITVNGELRAVGSLTNNGTIYNNYGIENVAGVEFDNEEGGYIKVDGSAKYTSVGNNAGVIEIENRQSEIHSDNNIGTILYTAEAGSEFVVLATDKYNAVKFNEGTALKVQMTDDEKPIQDPNALAIAEALTVVANAEGRYSFESAISGLEVSKNVYATIVSDVTVTKSMAVNTGATLHLGTGVTMEFNGTTEKFVNGGTFRNMGVLTAMCNQPEGTWTGSGLYSWGNENEAATTALQSLIDGAEEGDEVVMTESVVVSRYVEIAKTMTLDMNGTTLERHAGDNSEPVILADVEGAILTIDGDGTVKSSEQNGVWAMNGATIIIESGRFLGTSIFADKNSEVVINGGYFEGQQNAKDAKDEWTALNVRENSDGKITVTGGVFKNFNPKCNGSEGTSTNYLADGYKVVSYTDAECTKQYSSDAKNKWNGKADYWYKVVKIETETEE